MNFIRYDSNTGVITDVGFMDERVLQKEIDDGKPTLFTLNIADRNAYVVNLTTKEIEAVAQVAIITSELPDNNTGQFAPKWEYPFDIL
jgi:hypothetical protein